MNQLRQIDHLADMALEHQAELLRLAQTDGPQRDRLNRWRAGLFALVCLGVPVAFFLVRTW